MKHWRHAPLHLVDETGAYMITAGTYGKQLFFNTQDKLQYLHDSLLDLAGEFGWKMQAWAVFANHYHFIAVSPEGPEKLPIMISKLHTMTARHINAADGARGRKVWFQFWDNRITYQRSYYARLRYVHENPARHGLISNAAEYPWCSASWFERNAGPALLAELKDTPIDRLNIKDDF